MKAEPRPTKDVTRDSGTAMANGRWFRRLVRPIPRGIESNPVGIEIGLASGNVRLGFFMQIKYPVSFYRFATPKKAQQISVCPAGSWHFRIWRLAMAYRPNVES
jgi:hypothetical protein